MKYFLMKKMEFIDNKIVYNSQIEITRQSNSKEIMLYDEKMNNVWYSYLNEPNVKLNKIKKEDIEEQLEFVSLERMSDNTIESFCEVSEENFLKYLNIKLKRTENSRNIENVEPLKNIIKEIEDIILKYK